MFASEFPLQPVDDALYAGLENVLGHTDGSPALLTVGKDPQNSYRSSDPQFVRVVRNLTVVQQSDIKLYQLDL